MSPDTRQRGFAHEALLYDGTAGFIEGTLPFIREGVAAGEPVVVAVPGERLAALRAALGGEAERVHLMDMGRLGRNPARIISAWRDVLAEHGANGRPVRGVDEPIWAGRGADEIVECQRHETLLNLAFDDGPGWRLLCPYDRAALDPEVIDEAWRSHPLVWDEGVQRRSEAYVEPREALASDEDLPEPEGSPFRIAFMRPDVSRVRRLVARHAREAGFDACRTADLVLAVSEAANNSVLHGGGGGTLSIWWVPGGLVCEVRDRGHIADPLAGHTRPTLDRRDGRGMWLMNELCDLVQVRSLEEGSVVRLQLRAD
jgi:anti-sigma regulatory factor (Ser/Thr protein kinase)